MPNTNSEESTQEQQTTESAAQSSSAAQDGQTHSESNVKQEGQKQQSRGLRGSGLRYSADDGVPEWAVGKTADEILELGQQFYGLAMNPQQQEQQQMPQQQQTMQSVQQSGQLPRLPDSELQYTNPDEYSRQMQAYIQQQTSQAIQQASGPIAGSLAGMARDASKRDPDLADVWQEYAAEIDAEMTRIPPSQKTSVDAWNMAAQLIAGRHRKDLARKEAERLMAESGDSGTLGSQVSAPGGEQRQPQTPIHELFRQNSPAVKKFKAIGKTADDVVAHARAMGHNDLEAYANILKRRANVLWSDSGSPKTVEELSHRQALEEAGA